MASGNITTRTNLTTPTPSMLLYAGLSPFGVTDDRKITSNALFQEITANITDLTLGFGNGAAGTVSAAGKGKLRYNNTTQTFQTSVNGGAYSSLVTGHIVEANNVVTDFGAQSGGVFDNTAIFATAIASCQSTGKQLFIPAGTYLGNIVIPGYNSIRIFGEGPGRTIIQSSVGTSPVLFADNTSGLTHTLTIEELSLNCFGSGADDYGFRMSPDQPFDLTLRNIRINNVAQSGVYIPTNAFTLLLEGVDVSVLPAGSNGIDIFGDNTVTLIRCYVHAVGTNGAAYRLRSGRFTMIGCNLMDSGLNADGVIIGSTIATGDPVDAFGRVTMIGCNVEAFTNRGVYVKAGSQVSIHNTNFVSPGSGTVTGILCDNMSSTNPGIFDGLSGFSLNGTAAWANGSPINSNGVPFLQEGVPGVVTYYDTNLATAVNIGYRFTALNGVANRATQYFNRIALGVGSGEGFDGNLYFIDDDTRTIGVSTPGGRPQHIYVGTGGVHLGSGAVPFDGTNFSLTGGTSPVLRFNDGTIDSVAQSLTTVGMRVGTVSAHPLQILLTNTAIWEFTAAGDLRVLTGTHNIGEAAGNRPAIGYFSTSVNVGVPGAGQGAIVFGNANNTQTQSLEGALTPVSTNRFLWPAADPTAGQVLSASAPSAGVVTLSWIAAGSGGTPGGSTTQVQYNNAGAFAGSSGITLTATQATITGAIFIGSLRDSNNNILIAPTATASAVNYFTMANSATGQPVVFGAEGTDSSISIQLLPKDVSGATTAGQLIVPGGGRYDRPGITFPGLLTIGIHQNAGGGWFSINAINIALGAGGASGGAAAVVAMLANTSLAWGSSTATPIDAPPGQDLFIGRRGAASFIFGLADAAAPVAQTFTVQGVVAGTANTAGVNTTYRASASTGNTAGGSFIWQVTPLGGAGSSQNAYVTALTLAANGALTHVSASATAFESGPNGATNPVFRLVNSTASQAAGVQITGTATATPARIDAIGSGGSESLIISGKGPSGRVDFQGAVFDFYNGATRKARFFSASGTQLVLASDIVIGYTNSTTANLLADTSLLRHAANVWRIGDGSTGAGSLIIGTSAGAIGTSGAGVLAWALSTAPSTSPADTVQLYSQDAAAGDHNTYWRNEAGEITRATGLACRVSTQFDATTTTLANVTGLTRNVEAGRIYAFEAWLFIDADVVGGTKYAIAGTATATAIKYQITLLDNSTNALTINTRQTALAGASGQAGTTAGLAIIRGTITVNGAGTLTVQFAQNAAAGTSSVLTQSSFNLIPIG